jgi:hypothetical protein
MGSSSKAPSSSADRSAAATTATMSLYSQSRLRMRRSTGLAQIEGLVVALCDSIIADMGHMAGRQLCRRDVLAMDPPLGVTLCEQIYELQG